MKKIIRLLTLALLTVPVTTFAQSEGNQNTSEPAGKVVASKPDSLLDWETPHDPTCPQVLLETTMGNILVALYNDTPKHRDNFLKLVNSGYYDGCIFQRVIKNFMIQGGDYSCRKVNMEKPQKFDVNYTVPAEIIYPKYYHKRGQLCAAREGDDENPTKASASTDFYITWGRNFSPRQMEYYVEKLKRTASITPFLQNSCRRATSSMVVFLTLTTATLYSERCLKAWMWLIRFRMWLPIRQTTTDLSRISSS